MDFALAIRAVDAVIERPGHVYNPLFLHGPGGSGKTHLANAIAQALRAQGRARAVACLSAGTFVDEYVVAIQEGGVERWRHRYRNADVLILDDVHAFEAKERTQDELLHLFEHLLDRQAQVVLTSTRAPHDMRGLADQLRSRFESGLVVSLPVRSRQQVAAPRAVGALDRFFEDREKCMWHWSDLGDRLIEEFR